MAPPKKSAAAEAEKVALVATESVKYGGKRHLPGDRLLALPDDVDGLIAAGLAEVAPAEEKAPE